MSIFTTNVSKNGKDVRAYLIESDTEECPTSESDEALSKSLGITDKNSVLSQKIRGYDVYKRSIDPSILASRVQRSPELGPCVEAMAANVVGYGWRLVTKPGIQNLDHLKSKITEEFYRLDTALRAMNRKEGLQEVLKRIVIDMELTGSRFLEIVRSKTGIPIRMNHLPAPLMLMGRSKSRTKVNWKIVAPRVTNGEVQDFEVEELPEESVKFPVYFAKTGSSSNRKYIPFRSFGDTKSGRKAWNEVIFQKIYVDDYVYGLPRWSGAWLPLEGAYKAEQINFNTFKNNCVPNLAIMASGGKVSKGTLKRIQEFMNKVVRGSDSYSRVLLLETETAAEWYQSASQVKLHIERLKDEQHDDQLFQNYDKNSAAKVRRSFRMSSIFLGYDEQFTRATADAARRLVDEQVFSVERTKIESIFNDQLFPEMGVKYHLFRLNSPSVTDNEGLARIANLLERTGGVTPDIARMIVEKILNVELPFKDVEGFDKDKPYTLQLATQGMIGGQDVTQSDNADDGVAKRLMKQLSELESILLDGQK